ncbi:MAG: ATP-binding protein [Ilumatobacteraceae bacterium]|nr:ATP-binding protein [Ilumatobacteraceae bacterium]
MWDGVVGQRRAIERLKGSAVDPVHAYLFVGPPGSTKDVAARAFAALVLTGRDDPEARSARLALAGEHPDVREVRRVGASISADQIDDIVRSAALAPVEGDRKVMILDEFHLLDARGAARLLKTLEEPPASTMFVVLADQVDDELVTIASRCVRIEFAPIDELAIRDALIAEGHDADSAASAAGSAAGSLDRARVLVSDAGLAARRDSFASVPRRLDGTGFTAVTLADEITRLADQSAASLAPVHAAELAALDERVAAVGERGSGRKTLEDRHKREVRRYRTDELRSGLGVMAGAYRDALVAGKAPRPDGATRAVSRIHEALEALERNPNEPLLLQALLMDLPAL